MALSFILDEHLRGPLFNAIRRHHIAGGLLLDVIRVGDIDDLPLGSLDPAILQWCEQSGRLLVSMDYDTIPTHVANHVAAGYHIPGVLLIRPGTSLRQIVTHLELIAHAGTEAEYRDRIEFIPF